MPWLEDTDLTATVPGFVPRAIGAHGFPRDWPQVYTASRAMKSLLGKRGLLGATRAHVVYPPAEADLALIKGVHLVPLQSCVNAERVASSTGMVVEKGWAVYELFAAPASASEDGGAFVAKKHWFNRTTSGQPVDFTPRGPTGSAASLAPVLLVEAKEATQKERRVLTAEHLELHQVITAAQGFQVEAKTGRVQPRKLGAPPPARKIEPLPTSSDAACGAARQSARRTELAKSAPTPAAVQQTQPTAAAPPTEAGGKLAPAQKGRALTQPSPSTNGGASSSTPAKDIKRPIDYSKFDKIADSDEEREKTTSRSATGDSSRPTLRLVQTPVEEIGLDDYRAAFQALLDKATPPTVAPNVEAMFKAFKECTDTSDRALLDQACHAVEGLPAMTANTADGFEGWKTSTAQMTQAMLSRRRFDDARMWCVIRQLRSPMDIEPLHMHAWCLEEQFAQTVSHTEPKIRTPTLAGAKIVDKEVYAETLQKTLRAHLRRTIEISPSGRAPIISYAGLAASLERSGDLAGAREVGLEGTAAGVWIDEWQRCAHLVPGLAPRRRWHEPSAMELCNVLEQAAESIQQEFARYMAGGHTFRDVGIRSGEALLVERGSWRELPLFTAGRMDHEVCTQFPETLRILTERCADATGLAFCCGGEVAFRVLSPGTRLKPHCGPTNVRLTCQLGISVPLGAEPGVTVGKEPPRPWVDGKCIVFDDSFEHSEELDEMADGDCVVLTLHFWHPSFQHKNDPNWKTRGAAQLGVGKAGLLSP